MTIFIDDSEVIPLLAKMRLPKAVMLDLASKVGGERANVAPYEPASVPGFETWRWGTRYSREDQTLRDAGWRPCEEDQVSGIRNPDLNLKLVVCSTNINTGNPGKSPKNLSERGPASCKLIDRNSGQMNLGFVAADVHDDLWYFCLHLSEQFISLEISRPSSVIAGVVTAFSDRIIIAKPGDIPGIRRIVVDEDFAELPKPQVTRKLG